MSLETLKDMLPEYARDLRLNLSSLATEPNLTKQQRAGTFVAAALAARNPDVTRHVIAEYAPMMSPEALTAAKAAASIMAMNNVYYRFAHLVGGEYPNLPAKLRMSVIGRPGVDKADFELWSLAVSAVNGCGTCMQAHDRAVRAAGLTAEHVQAAVRIAAVVHGVAVTLAGEAALTDQAAGAV
ncbi:MAG TPA: carboxymuconolactone decarboxylase family protein [Acetobacteraceae bacterium]|nr:carboxymuconolactone decarboxylase family protein [Acetobacteraceae bacterium]